jgi:hypothetical protein
MLQNYLIDNFYVLEVLAGRELVKEILVDH